MFTHGSISLSTFWSSGWFIRAGLNSVFGKDLEVPSSGSSSIMSVNGGEIELESGFKPSSRVMAPTEGRNSIVYAPLNPSYDTTRFFFVDNKASDISSLNVEQDHSDFFTNIIHNSDVSVSEASTQDITLDNRSRWVGTLNTSIKTCCPNVTEFNNTNSVRARLPVKKDEHGEYVFEWANLTIPEGSYNLGEIIDMLNVAVVDHYLENGRVNKLGYDEIGLKFDTRNFNLGRDPITTLVTPGRYTYKAFHPDIVLLPGCAVDFTHSRISNILGIRKSKPYQSGFVITYDDLDGGNIPALLDVTSLGDNGEMLGRELRPIYNDDTGVSYRVKGDSKTGFYTEYRSWALAYHSGGSVREWTLLVDPDVTGGLGQMYWSMPNAFMPPSTFSANARTPELSPVVAAELFPISQRSVYNASSVYAQMVEMLTNSTMVFDRFPTNEILKQPPYSTVTWISENIPSVKHHGAIPIRHSLSGVQRVTVTDDRRRTCPYVYKCLASVDPSISSSSTLR
ncbi:III protein [Amniota adenovirus 1]|nr:III protein [Amniota adenovirus 1]